MKKIKRSHYLVISTIIATMTLVNSCFDPEWDFERFSDEVVLSPGIAAPIAYGYLTLDDLITGADLEDYVLKDEDHLLYLSYTDELFSFSANEILNIPDQNFLEFFFNTDVVINPTDDTVRFHKDKDGVFVMTNNSRLDSIHIKTMDLVVDVTSSFKHTGLLTITSESILVDGQPFREVVQISDASGNFSYTATIPLDGHSVYLDNSRPDTSILPLSFDLELVNSGDPVSPGESCNITMTFVDPEFYAVFGYLGDYDLLISDGDIRVDIFDTEDLNGGSILFADPSFTLTVNNSYGVPVEIDISNVSAYSSINDVTENIIFQPGVNPFSIGAPSLSQVGDTIETVIEINKDNCNLVDVMEIFPSTFEYSISAITNPDGPGTQNFATDTSNLGVDFEVTLPVYINAKGFTLEETSEFDFEKEFGEFSDMVEYLRFTMDASNGMPFDVKMQLYFQDINSVTLDSMFVDNAFLLPPFLDTDDKVSQPREQSKWAELTKERIEKIKPCKQMLIKGEVNTSSAGDGRYVKFYDYYAIDFKIKMKADLTINSRDL